MANNFAYRQQPDSGNLGSPWKRGFLAVLSCVLLAAGSGCGMLGQAPSSDPTDDIINGSETSAEEISVALAATWDRMQLAPREPYWAFRMGELYTAVDSTAEAVPHLERALDLDPTYAPAVALLSKVHYESQRYEDAVILLENFLSYNPSAPEALHAALALHLEAVGDIERAQAVLDNCSGNSKEVRTARTFVSLRGDDLESVLETAKQALDADPGSAANHNNYGIALLYAGRPYEARQAFQTALELNEELPGALYNMAIVEAFYFFDDETGRKWFARYKQYASDDPDDLEALFSADVSSLEKTEPKE